MPGMMSRIRTIASVGLAMLAVAPGAVLAQTGNVSSKESDLAAAGFVARTADTQEQQDMLARLPTKKLLLRSYQGVTHYVYADPKGCNCIYVGDAAAYQAFTKTRQQAANANMQEWAAQDFADSRWNWGAWGGFGPGFRWGPVW